MIYFRLCLVQLTTMDAQDKMISTSTGQYGSFGNVSELSIGGKYNDSTQVQTLFFSDDPEIDRKIKMIVLGISMVLCATPFCNIITVIAVYRKPSLRTKINLLIINLSLGDMGVGFTFMMNIILSTLDLFPESRFVCILSTVSLVTPIALCLYTIGAIAVERYLAIVHPFIYERVVTHKRMTAVCIVLWLYSALQASWIWGIGKWSPGTYCVVENVFPVLYSILYVDSHCVVVQGASLVLYYRMFKVALKHRRAIQAQEISVESKVKSSDFKSAKMMFMIIIFMLINWTPFTVMHMSTLFVNLQEQTTGYKVTYVAAVYITTLNSSINPVVYAWQSTPFRAAYKEILGIKLNQKEESYTSKHVATVS